MFQLHYNTDAMLFYFLSLCYMVPGPFQPLLFNYKHKQSVGRIPCSFRSSLGQIRERTDGSLQTCEKRRDVGHNSNHFPEVLQCPLSDLQHHCGETQVRLFSVEVQRRGRRGICFLCHVTKKVFAFNLTVFSLLWEHSRDCIGRSFLSSYKTAKGISASCSVAKITATARSQIQLSYSLQYAPTTHTVQAHMALDCML